MLPIINPFHIQRDSFNTPHSTFHILNTLNTPHYKSLSTCEKICVYLPRRRRDLCY